MKTLVFYSFLLFLAVNFWSSSVSAAAYFFTDSGSARAACDSYASNDNNTECQSGGARAWIARKNNTTRHSYEWQADGSCPSSRPYSNSAGQCLAEEPAPVCTSNTIPGFGLYGSSSTGETIVIGDTGPRIANVDSCAYTCYVNYDMLDGYTTFGDAHQCTGMSQPFVDQEPSSYTDPDVCSVRSNLGSCLELTQESGPCAAGTTYGRVNDIDVCVPSGTSTAAADAGSTGVPDAGGSQQATGTADAAGTGGLETGSGTSTGSSSSTSTTNADGTVTTIEDSTEDTKGPKTFKGHGDPASWWVSKYPDGAAGMGESFQSTIQDSALIGILSPLKTLPDSGSAPTWSMNFNLGPMGNFGSFSFVLPNGFWLFIKFCVLFTAAMTCRALIFGG
jgi:hypothetical protein